MAKDNYKKLYKDVAKLLYELESELDFRLTDVEHESTDIPYIVGFKLGVCEQKMIHAKRKIKKFREDNLNDDDFEGNPLTII